MRTKQWQIKAAKLQSKRNTIKEGLQQRTTSVQSDEKKTSGTAGRAKLVLFDRNYALNTDAAPNYKYSETCVRQPPMRQTLNSEGWCGKVTVL